MLVIRVQGRHGGKAFGRRPGLDARAAPGGINQPDRHAQFLVQFPAEIISRGRKAAPAALGDCLAASRPSSAPSMSSCGCGVQLLATFSRRMPGWSAAAISFCCIPRHADAHLHVGLPGAEPHLAHHHVVELHGAGAANREGVGPARLHCRQHDLPFATLVGLGLSASPSRSATVTVSPG